MSNYLEFKNQGEIPINAFKLLGASTKRGDDTKIGYFGTGLKYALAVLLREGVDFKIFIGTKELKINTRKTDFAGQKIDVMTVNGEKTSITIEAGIDWEPWFAIREIYSNTIDEGGSMELVDNVGPSPGHTTIYVEMSGALGDVSKNWQDYFAFKRPALFESDMYRVLAKRANPAFIVFRKGIRVHYESRKKSLFDYDVQKMTINESRVASQPWEVKQRCAEALAVCDNQQVIKTYVEAFPHHQQFIEFEPEHWTYLFDDVLQSLFFSEAWYEVLKNKRIVPIEQSGFYGMSIDSVAFPEKLIKKLHDYFGDRLNLVGHAKEKFLITGDYDSRLDDAMELLDKNGFKFEKEHIKIAKFKDRGLLGAWDADNNLVLISEEILTPTYEHRRAAILFEEIAHARSGFGDNTRAFQDYIISAAVGLMKK